MGAPLQLARAAQCYCGVTENFPPELGLPAGWRELAGTVQCPDCASAAQPALIPAERAVRGDHGCRVFASPIGGDAVVLRIHAGALPIAAELDKPLHFVARADDLAELIAELERIRAAIAPPRLTAGEVDRFAARVLAEGGVLETRRDGVAVLTIPVGRLAGAPLSPARERTA